MQRLIIFLVRTKLGLKKYQQFRFINQRRKTDSYYFTATKLLKIEGCTVKESSCSLNWLLNNECEIVKLNKEG